MDNVTRVSDVRVAPAHLARNSGLIYTKLTPRLISLAVSLRPVACRLEILPGRVQVPQGVMERFFHSLTVQTPLYHLYEPLQGEKRRETLGEAVTEMARLLGSGRKMTVRIDSLANGGDDPYMFGIIFDEDPAKRSAFHAIVEVRELRGFVEVRP